MVDPDTFEEHNLNRQILASPANLGVPKVDAAVERVGSVNPAVRVIPVRAAFSRENGADLFSGAEGVVDALDTVTARMELAHACRDLGIPMVHGAIAGWYGQMATQMPGEDISPLIYPTGKEQRAWKPGSGTRRSPPPWSPACRSRRSARSCSGRGNA